ncbi:MAG: hypothetical protein ACTSU6_02585 [Candidatus Njordarchaeales archaeon]
MSVGRVSSVGGVALAPPTRVEQLAKWIMSQIGKARRDGKDQINFALQDNEVTRLVLDRFSEKYDVGVEKSNALKVTVSI